MYYVNIGGNVLAIPEDKQIFERMFAPSEPLPSPADSVILRRHEERNEYGVVIGTWVCWMEEREVEETKEAVSSVQ